MRFGNTIYGDPDSLGLGWGGTSSPLEEVGIMGEGGVYRRVVHENGHTVDTYKDALVQELLEKSQR